MQKTFEEKLFLVKQIKEGEKVSHLSRLYHVKDERITEWVWKYDKYGESGLLPLARGGGPREDKEEILRKHFEESVSLTRLRVDYRVGRTTLERWVREARVLGRCQMTEHAWPGKTVRIMGKPKKRKPETEMEKLQYENYRLKAENALLKKVQALVLEKHALLKSGHKPSTN